MNNDRYLYQKMEEYVMDEVIKFDKLPPYIINNLATKIKLRDYQVEAFNYFIEYYESNCANLRRNKQIHLLFHMATGSGKTVMMSGLMLYLYKKGFKNFLFFVDTNNIIEKTRSNFLEKTALKYLFGNEIVIEGKRITVNEVENFQSVDENAINIKFTTVQQLHIDLNKAKENSLTINDFEDKKIVLIADEAHHINSETKSGRLTVEEKKNKESWERSVHKIYQSNKDNILLEFTATADLKNEAINEKYIDKIIYNYPLLKFRESGYTKEFMNFQTNYSEMYRVLVAILLSQYRLKLFNKHNLNKKPAILLKSRTINDSKLFYEEFHNFIKNDFNEDIIEEIYIDTNNSSEQLLKQMFEFFNNQNISFKNLAIEIRDSFSENHTIIMNSKDDATAEKQRLVNDLENLNNPIRMIFTVDMLNEGWDVLNLYDIVRLYETRQAGRTISKTTISEAQLIGRGARYYPFAIDELDIPDKRKYDDNPEYEMRICETLLYHSKQDSRYIQELRDALKEIGFEAENTIEFEYVVKESFKDTKLYKEGKLFKNTKRKRDRKEINSLPSNFRVDTEINLTVSMKRHSLISNEKTSNKSEYNITKYKLKELNNQYPHLVQKAFRQFPPFRFNILQGYFPNLKSLMEFITSDDYAGVLELIIKHNKDLSSLDIYKALLKQLNRLSNNILSIEEEYEGTNKFIETPLKNHIKDIRRKKSNPDKEGEGISQNADTVNNDFKLDLSEEKWFAYNDNYGTSEEKRFVKYFSDRVDELKFKYAEVYLIRNERSFHIYSFIDGLRFEPDYILILKKDKNDYYEQEQIFIEPKGGFLLKQDAWKEEFLNVLEYQAEAKLYHNDGNDYKIIGLPFFNHENNTNFKDKFDKLIER